jgi:hypothetical protein
MVSDTAGGERIASELREFRRSAVLFSGGQSLLDEYDGQWIAAVGGEVKAQADSYDGIFVQMAELGVDPRYALVRHVQRNQRTLII